MLRYFSLTPTFIIEPFFSELSISFGKILFYFLSAARNIYYRKIIRNTAVFLQKKKYVLRGVSQPSVNVTGIRKPKACRRMLTVVEHSLLTATQILRADGLFSVSPLLINCSTNWNLTVISLIERDIQLYLLQAFYLL